MEVKVIVLVEVFLLMKKSWLSEQPVGIMAKQCMNLHCRAKKWKEETKLTASDAALGDFFGSSVAISGYTLLFGAPFKYGKRGATYVSVLAGDGS